MTKEKIINAIKNLPDPVTVDDVIDNIVLLEKIEKGLEQSVKGNVVSDDDLPGRLNKWSD